MKNALIPLLAIVLAAAAGAARADDSADASPQTGSPSAAASQGPPLRALCTDRPTRSSSPCTVDLGHFQIETDIGNVTVDHSGGADTTTALYTNPTLKYGVSDTVDVELNIAPYETIVSRDRASNITSRNNGVGDLYLRMKWALVGNGGSDFGLTLYPYVKAPTATGGVGDGAWEGGLIVPIAFNLPAGWSAVMDPEIDILKDPQDPDHHLGYSSLICLTHALTKTINGSVELWGGENYQPGHGIKQVSADVATTWTPASQPDLPYDAGLHFGLHSPTPAAQLYVGVSKRF